MSDFKTDDEWSKLNNAERLEYCRKAASLADEHAATAAPAMRDIYRRLAEQWRKMAANIEAAIKDEPRSG